MNDWKKDLRERFSDASMPEPEGLWEGIEEGLSGSRKKVFPFWWPLIGVAAAAAVAALFFLPGSSSLPSGKEPVAVVERTMDTAGEPEILPDIPSAGECIPSSVPPRGRSVSSRPSDSAPASRPESVSEPISGPGPIPESLQPSDPSVPAVPSGLDEPSDPEKSSPEPSVSEDEPVHPVDFPEEAPKARRMPSVQIGISSSGALSSSSTSTRYGFSLPETRSNAAYFSTALPYVALTNTENETTVREGLPIRYGIMLSVQLSPRWVMETGLLRSTRNVSTTVNSHYLVTEEKRTTRFIAVPLDFRYIVTHPSRPYQLYVSGGLLWEKADLEQTVSKTVIGNYSQENLLTDNTPDRSLWSAVATVGAQVRPVPRWPVSLFAEPGISLIFAEMKNGEGIPVSYSPQFTFSTGIRFTIVP